MERQRGLATRKLSVRPSVTRVHCDKMEERSVQFLPRCMKCRRGIAMRILSVRLSVCPSVTRVIPDKMEERSDQIFTPYERTFILVF